MNNTIGTSISNPYYYTNPAKNHLNQITIENNDVYQHYFQDSSMNMNQNKRDNSNHTSNLSLVSSSSNYNKYPIRNKGNKAQTITNIINDKSKIIEDLEFKRQVQEAIAKKKEKKYQKFQNLLHAVENASIYASHVDEQINNINIEKELKKKKQFEDWNENVHGLIQKKLTQRINQLNSKELHQKKLESYNKFIDITNNKPNIFRDIIIESEYDPLEVNRSAVKVNVNPKTIRDPLKLSQQKGQMESNILSPNKLSSIELNTLTQGKYTLPVELWAKGKIESTPCGFASRNISTKSVDKLAQSSVVFNDYDFPRTKEAIDQEMPRGKKTFASF